MFVGNIEVKLAGGAVKIRCVTPDEFKAGAVCTMKVTQGVEEMWITRSEARVIKAAMDAAIDTSEDYRSIE